MALDSDLGISIGWNFYLIWMYSHELLGTSRKTSPVAGSALIYLMGKKLNYLRKVEDNLDTMNET